MQLFMYTSQYTYMIDYTSFRYIAPHVKPGAHDPILVGRF